MATRPGPIKGTKRAMTVRDEAVDKREFRKTNEAIGLRVVQGNMTLLARKVFNVLMYHAQQAKSPGLNAPIDTAAASKYFWIPLAELARDAAYGSNDAEYLKRQLEEMQNIRLVMENDRQWTSEHLLASVTLVKPPAGKKNGGQVWFGFAFPPEAHEQVMSPNTFTRLSIVYQSLLKSGSALALYETCRRYATNPSKLTFVQDYEYWYGVITGNPISSTPPPYKYFKRDTLKPAIAEVNSLTDITIELVEHKNGRRVEKLQFKVDLARQPNLDFPAPPLIDTELLGQVMNFGLTQSAASDVIAKYADDVVRLAVSRVRARLESSSMTPLVAPAGYFMWALQEIVKSPHAHQLAAPKTTPKPKSGPSVMERFMSERANDALVIYKEMNDEQKAAVLGEFKKRYEGKGVGTDKVLEHAVSRNIFAQWYAKDLWGEPTAEALAAFIEKM